MLGFMAFGALRGIYRSANNAVGNYNKTHPYRCGDVRNMGYSEQTATAEWRKTDDGRRAVAQWNENIKGCNHSKFWRHPVGDPKNGDWSCSKCNNGGASQRRLASLQEKARIAQEKALITHERAVEVRARNAAKRSGR